MRVSAASSSPSHKHNRQESTPASAARPRSQSKPARIRSPRCVRLAFSGWDRPAARPQKKEEPVLFSGGNGSGGNGSGSGGSNGGWRGNGGDGGGGDDSGDSGLPRGTGGITLLQVAAAAAAFGSPSSGAPDAAGGEPPTAEDLQRIRRLLREAFRDLTDARQRWAEVQQGPFPALPPARHRPQCLSYHSLVTSSDPSADSPHPRPCPIQYRPPRCSIAELEVETGLQPPITQPADASALGSGRAGAARKSLRAALDTVTSVRVRAEGSFAAVLGRAVLPVERIRRLDVSSARGPPCYPSHRFPAPPAARTCLRLRGQGGNHSISVVQTGWRDWHV